MDFLGKRILVTSGGHETTEADLRRLVQGLCARDSLRSLGSVYAALENVSESVPAVHGVPVPLHTIPYLALVIILECDDRGGSVLDDTLLATCVRTYHSMAEEPLDDAHVFEFLLRLGQSQFSLQARDPYLVPRTLVCFRDLWPSCPEAANLDIRGAIRTITGVDLEPTLLFGQAFWARAANGYVTPYSGQLPAHPAASLFTAENQGQFLQWLAADYAQIREKALRDAPRSPGLTKYRFNPLAIHPLVLPDQQPPELKDGPAYVVPCRQFLLDRVTVGLVHDLHLHLRQAFDQAFGLVFQAYVGRLLSAAHGDHAVRPEFPYKLDGTRKQSPDWIVMEKGRATVVEVKKTLLRRRARTYGLADDVRADVERYLRKAVAQLLTFQRDAHAMADMPDPRDLELVVVTWDDTWWANSILMRDLEPELDGVVVHVLSISELERFLGLSEGGSLYDALWAKRNSADVLPRADMHDYLSHVFGSEIRKNTFLAQVYIDFLAKWQLPAAGQHDTGF